jgi:hypothetical protein
MTSGCVVMKRAFAASLLLLVAAIVQAETPSGVEDKAAEMLRKMSAFLSGTQRFSLEAEETLDAPSGSGLRAELSNVRKITVERPNHFVASARGDTLNRAAWYDGHTLAILNTLSKVYVTLDAPATIDGVLDKVAQDLGLVIPLSDFVYSDPYESLMDGVVAGKYLGIHEAGGTPCHHLSFSQGDFAWQIWIDAGAQPLPRKFVVDYGEADGSSRYSATFRSWDLKPRTAPALFKFTPPPGAQALDLQTH